MLYLQIESPKSSVLNFLDSNSFEVIISIFQRTEKVPDMERLQPIDPFAQIHISAGNHDSADTGSIFKHEAPPAAACKAGTLKYRLIIPASGGLI